MLTPLLPHMFCSHFGDTCNLGFNGSTKLKESLLSLIPFWRATLALVLECYVQPKIYTSTFFSYVNYYASNYTEKLKLVGIDTITL
jgi:hypothetical protein